jgi:hypothetical protein
MTEVEAKKLAEVATDMLSSIMKNGYNHQDNYKIDGTTIKIFLTDEDIEEVVEYLTSKFMLIKLCISFK